MLCTATVNPNDPAFEGIGAPLGLSSESLPGCLAPGIVAPPSFRLLAVRSAMSFFTPPTATTAPLFSTAIFVNTATDTELRTALTAGLGVARWVDEVASAAPFASLDELLAAAGDAGSLSRVEVDEALDHHPRIGEKPGGEGASQAFSRVEQASVDADDKAVNAQIADGNRAYEERFGRVFLIRAAGRSRVEILAELHRRLSLDDAAEQRIVGEQLLEIARIRLTQMFAREPA